MKSFSCFIIPVLSIVVLSVGTTFAYSIAPESQESADRVAPPKPPECSSYEDLACQSEWADYYMQIQVYLYSKGINLPGGVFGLVVE
jgi:hypothetical protein